MKISLQEYADKSVTKEHQQPLKNIHEALAVHGWDVIELGDGYTPWCCGTPVELLSFLGDAYHAECSVCGQFIHDITGPSFGNSYVNLIDSEKVDCTGPCWIAGTQHKAVA